MFVSHARTPEELKEEICSDLRRRLEALDGYKKLVSRSKAEQARAAYAERELSDMLRYWMEVQLIRPEKKRGPRGAVSSREARGAEEISGSRPLPHLSTSKHQ